MPVFRIGQVARQAGVGVETVRYYERQGLLAEPERQASGYRRYDDAAVARLLFIRRTKELGFTLAEIKELLGLRFDATTGCEHVRRLAEEKIAGIEDKIRTLQSMKRSLKKVVTQCEQRKSMTECPLWEGLGPFVEGRVRSESPWRRKKSS